MTYPTFPNPAITWASFPEPCYDPQEKYGDCPADLLSIINDERIPAEDRIWAFAVCTELPDSAKRIFAVRCVRETPLSDGRKVVDLITDHRSLNALDIAYKHAIGEASDEELAAARAAARAAVRDSALAAIRDAAWAAAMDAVRDAARAAAWAAVMDAARAPAWDAARAPAWAPAWAAAMDAAWDAQIEIAKSLLQ